MTPIETKARTIAACLPGRWRYAPLRSEIQENWYKHRDNPKAADRYDLIIQEDGNQGRAINLRSAWEDESRFCVTGCLGQSRTSHRITVAQSRPAKAIAADIARRLLPDYAKAFEEWQADQAEKDRCQQQLDLQMAFLRSQWPKMRDYAHGSSEMRLGIGNGITLKIYPYKYNGEVYLDGKVSMETAVKILKLIDAEKERATCSAQ